MLQSVIVLSKGVPCVVRWINVYALDFPSEVLLQRLERNQIVAMDQHVLTCRVAVGLILILNEDTRFDRLLLVVFADPCQLEFSFFSAYLYLLKLQYNADQKDGIVNLEASVGLGDFPLAVCSEATASLMEGSLEQLELLLFLVRLFPDIYLFIEIIRGLLLFTEFLDFRVHFLVLHDELLVLDAYPVLDLSPVIFPDGFRLSVEFVKHFGDEIPVGFPEHCVFIVGRFEVPYC